MQKTHLSKLSVGYILSFFIFLGMFYLTILLGERGGQTFFSNLKLTIPMLIATASAISSFFIGIIAILKNKEYSILVILSTIIGFLVLVFTILEFSFPH